MRRSLAIVLGMVAAVLATVSTVLVVSADLPAGETAGKIALVWLPVMTTLAVVSSRRTRRAIGRI